MRVVIEIQSGSQAVRKLLLRNQELLVFGRSGWADVAFEQDEHMSARHFSLEAVGGQVYCRDLGSVNGTTVNQRPVQETRLRDGDVIVAGRTQLVVRIEGEGTQSSTGAAASDRAPGIPPGQAASVSSGAIVCTQAECSSGLTRVRGGKFGEAGQPAAASHLAQRLAELCPLSLVVHAQRFKHPALDNLYDGVPVYDWLPKEVAAGGSPMILPPESQADRWAIIEAGWDKNAVLCFYSRRSSSELIQHLRSATRFRVPSDGGDAGDAGDNPADVNSSDTAAGPSSDAAVEGVPRPSLLGFCWPNVLSPLLAFSQPAFARQLLDGIELVLMEVPDRPRRWQILCGAEMLPALEWIGFTTATAAE